MLSHFTIAHTQMHIHANMCTNHRQALTLKTKFNQTTSIYYLFIISFPSALFFVFLYSSECSGKDFFMRISVLYRLHSGFFSVLCMYFVCEWTALKIEWENTYFDYILFSLPFTKTIYIVCCCFGLSIEKYSPVFLSLVLLHWIWVYIWLSHDTTVGIFTIVDLY